MPKKIEVYVVTVETKDRLLVHGVYRTPGGADKAVTGLTGSCDKCGGPAHYKEADTQTPPI